MISKAGGVLQQRWHSAYIIVSIVPIKFSAVVAEQRRAAAAGGPGRSNLAEMQFSLIFIVRPSA